MVLPGGRLLAFLLLPGPAGALLAVPPPAATLSHRHRPSPPPSRLPFRRGAPSLLRSIERGSFDRLPRRRAGRPLRSSAVAQDDAATEEDAPLALAAAVGAVASLVGYAYSRCMAGGFRLLWRTLPAALLGSSSGGRLGDLLRRNPAAYVVLVTTLGGSLVATVKTLYFSNQFNAHDYVHVLSGSGPDKMEGFPQLRSVWPLLGMSLVTSISGFSLGPEAPMVTVGGLVGVSLARRYLRSRRNQSSSSSSVEETLAYAGAAGTLTGFMNVPLAGPIFALEMTSRGAGVSPRAARSLPAAMAACLAGTALVRGVLVPHAGVGGHFTHGARAAVGTLAGRETVLAGLACGVGGALVGTAFHKTLRLLKSAMWPTSTSEEKKNTSVHVSKKVLVALAIGLLSALYPQTMFWGEGSLQCAVDGQCTPFSATPHAIPAAMMKFARVDPDLPFATGGAALQVGAAKFAAIALAAAGGYPGGVIFPLLSNGASLAHALLAAARPLLPTAASSLVPPLVVTSLMSATLTSITRTPLATVLILAMTASGTTPLSALLPGTVLASYVSVWASDRLSRETFFSYSE